MDHVHEACKESCEKGKTREESPTSHGYSERACYDEEELEEGEIREDGPPSSDDHIHKEIHGRYANLRRSASTKKAFHQGACASNMEQSTFLRINSVKRLVHPNVLQSFCNSPKERHQQKEHVYFKYSDYHWILKKIEKVCLERLDQLLLRQKEDREGFNILKKQELEILQEHHVASYKVHAAHVIPTIICHRVKLPKQHFSILCKRFHKHMQSQLRKFVAQQVKDRNRERKIKENWINKAKSGRLDKRFYEISLSYHEFKMENFKWQLTDYCSDEEPLKYFDMRCLTTEIEAIFSSRAPEDALTVGAAEKMPSVVESRSSQSKSNCANTVEFCEKGGTEVACSAAVQNEGEIMGKTSASQSVTYAVPKLTKAVTADSENAAIAREKQGCISSDSDVSEGSQSKSQKKYESDNALNQCKTGLHHKSKEVPSYHTSSISQVGELSDMHVRTPTLTTGVTQQQYDNSTCQTAVHPYAPPGVNTRSARNGLDCPGVLNTQVEPTNQAPASSTVQEFLPENGLHPNPLTIELSQLLTLRDLITKRHEEKREQLILAREIEMAQAKRKFDDLIYKSEMETSQGKKNLKIISNKIYKQQILAEGFQIVFNANAGVVSDSLKVATERFVPLRSQLSQQQVSPIAASIPIPGSAAMYHSSQFLGHSAASCSLEQTSATTQQSTVASLRRSTAALMHTPSGGVGTGFSLRAPAPHLRTIVHPLAASNCCLGVASLEK